MSGQNPPPDQPSSAGSYGSPGEQPPQYGHPTGQQPAGQQPAGQSPDRTGHQQPPAYGAYPGGQPDVQTDAKGFFGALFDFSFNSFVTPKIVKFVYVLATILLVIAYLFFVITAFAGDNVGFGIAFLLLGWIPFLFYLALIRMTLEFYFSIVRMSQDINERLPR